MFRDTMIQAVSMDSSFGENIQNVWRKHPVINENFGSVRIDAKQHRDSMQPFTQPVTEPVTKPVMEPVMEPVVNSKRVFDNYMENFDRGVSYFGKNNPENVSLLVTGCIFLFFSWLSICYLISKSSDSYVMYGGLFVYFCVSVSFIVSVIYKLVKKCL